MTREEAIEYWEQFNAEIDDLYDACSDADRDVLVKQREIVEYTISALRQQETVTNRNEPLTLDELREAAETGDPVWLERENCSSWVVIEKVDDRKYIQLVDYSEFGSDEPYDFAISDYGDSFKAYRQKPEEGTV